MYLKKMKALKNTARFILCKVKKIELTNVLYNK